MNGPNLLSSLEFEVASAASASNSEFPVHAVVMGIAIAIGVYL
jgi:hypothetical protein